MTHAPERLSARQAEYEAIRARVEAHITRAALELKARADRRWWRHPRLLGPLPLATAKRRALRGMVHVLPARADALRLEQLRWELDGHLPGPRG